MPLDHPLLDASRPLSRRRSLLGGVLAGLSLITATVVAIGSVGVPSAEAGPYGSTVTIDGKGTYHAIGLGQWGALGYAIDDNWSTEQILSHYYGGTVAAEITPGDVTMLLSALNGAQTAVVHDKGRARVVGESGRWSSVVARENANGRYDIWGRTGTPTCPSASDPLSAEDGWTKIASGKGPSVTFRTVSDDAATSDLSDLLGVCAPAGSVRYYRGRIQSLNDNNGTARTINLVPTEMMLRSVVAWEMSPSWADLGGGRGARALEAQAVAARGYVWSYAWYSYARSCDNMCVAYRGAAARLSGPGSSRVVYEDPRATAAVDATANQVRRRGSASGPIALTMYSASTGGWTAPSIGLAAFPAVEDAGDDYRAGLSGGNPWHSWTRTVSVATIEARWPSLGELRSIEVDRNGYGDWGGRATGVTLVGSDDTVELSGDSFPRAVGLPSNWFRVRGDSTPTTSTSTTTTSTTSNPPVQDCGLRTAPAVVERLGTSAASGLHPARGRVLADTRGDDRLAADCTLVVPTRMRAGTTAVVVNVTAVSPAAAGLITVYACGTSRPSVPTLLVDAGRSSSAGSIVALGRSRALCVHSTVSTHVVLESYGRFSGRGVNRFTPLAPLRRLDTRDGAIVPANREISLRLTGRDRIPSSAAAVAATVHAMRSTSRGVVRIYPCAAGPSDAAILSIGPGQTVANGVTAVLDRSGRVCLRSTTAVHLMLDVTGWYGRTGAGLYRAVVPQLVGDTRTGTLGSGFAPLENRPITVAGRGPVPRRGVLAIAGQVTVTDVPSESYLTVHRCATTVPELSMVRNVPPSRQSASATVVGLSRGRWCLRPGTSMHVRIDALGWFTAS